MPEMFRSGVLASLALWEMTRLLRHPLVIGGALGSYAFVLNHINSASPSDVYAGITSAVAFVLGPSAFFAANLVASRTRRSNADEMVAAVPTQIRDRTAAVLLATLGTAVLTVAVVAAVVLTYVVLDIAPARWPPIAELAVQPVTVLGGAMLGVMTARWLPWAGAALLVMVALYWMEVALSIGWPAKETAVALLPFSDLRTADQSGRIVRWFSGSVPLHLAYLLCLDVMAAIGALLATPGPKRALLVAGATAVTGACLTGWLQLP